MYDKKKMKKTKGAGLYKILMSFIYPKEIIGKGAYGCVITPPINDNFVIVHREYIDKKKNDVGKLFKRSKHSKESFFEEIQNIKFTESFDPNHEFTINMKGANVINSQNITDDIRECLGITNQNENIYQIIMDNGGKEIDKLKDKSMTFEDFLRMIEVFLKGISKMQDSGICHRDIKPANVVVNNSKITLIDFGLAEKLENIYLNENLEILKYLYLYYPPEFYIAHILLPYQNNKFEFQNELDNVINKMKQNNYLNQLFKKEALQDVISQIQRFLQYIKENDFEYEDVFNNKLALKTDIYSLFSIFESLGNKIDIQNEVQQEYIKTLVIMCKKLNPCERASINDLLNYIYAIKSTPSNMSGGNFKRYLKFSKIHNNKCNTERFTPFNI